jgi:hypothetical protein
MFIFRSIGGTHVVDAKRTARLIAIVLFLSAVVFVNTSYGYPLAFELSPVALVLGTLLGLAVISPVPVWRDAESGALWMAEGKRFLVVWGALVAIRIVLVIVSATTATGPDHTQQEGWVALSSSFLVASMGLWIARGVFIYRHVRAAH